MLIKGCSSLGLPSAWGLGTFWGFRKSPGQKCWNTLEKHLLDNKRPLHCLGLGLVMRSVVLKGVPAVVCC